jgi:hypothetical protein
MMNYFLVGFTSFFILILLPILRFENKVYDKTADSVRNDVATRAVLRATVLEQVESCINNERESNNKEKSILENLLTQPLVFEKNTGQLDDNVQFVARSVGGVTYYFTKDNVSIMLSRKVINDDNSDGNSGRVPPFQNSSAAHRTHVLKITFVDANPSPTITPESPTSTKTNYFLGNDPSRWHTDIPNYDKIRYHNVYDGIDLVYYGNGKQLEYDFLVAPGADPTVIKIRYDGSEEALQLLSNGNVAISTSVGMLHEYKPTCYQINEREQHKKQNVRSAWIINDNNTLQFALGDYDRTRTLYIDPLIYSTFLGGSSNEDIGRIAVDDSGKVYITSSTSSSNFPVTAGAYDVTYNGGVDIFVTKFNDAGSARVYSTFIGSGQGDYPYGIVIDSGRNVYLTGYTRGDVNSPFPTTSGAYDTVQPAGGEDNIFVLKLNATGNGLIFSTFIKGSTDDVAYTLNLDNEGNSYIGGYTKSSNFPHTPNAYDTTFDGPVQDAFISKLNSTGTVLLFSTFIGGFGIDAISYGIAVDADNMVYVAGYTDAEDFPTTAGAYDTDYDDNTDIFITKLDSSGSSLQFSTFVGGSGYDEPKNLILDDDGNILFCGVTSSSNFPTTSGAYDQTYDGGTNPFYGTGDGFISKLNSSGTSMLYSTYIGGNGVDAMYRILIDSLGNYLCVGTTSSSNFPTTRGAYDRTFNGGNIDAALIKLDPTGSVLLYGSYFGGSSDELGLDMELGTSGTVYFSGWVASTDFPTTSGAYDQSHNGGNDVYVTKLHIRGSVHGRKFNDINANGVYDNGEPGLSGWKIYLTGASIDSTTTNSSGNFIFSDLAPGSYTVSEAVNASWLQTYPSEGYSYSVTLADLQDDSAKVFGNYEYSSVVVRKYADLDNNFSTTGDWTLYPWGLRVYKDSISETTLLGSVTSSSLLTLSTLLPGTYIAVEDDSTGWTHKGKRVNGTPTATSVNADTFTILTTEHRTIDFVNYRPRYVTIRKNEDLDGNPQTTDDWVPKKWFLRLYRTLINPDSIVGTVTSAESLQFVDLPSATYIAREADSTGWTHLATSINGNIAEGQETELQFAVSGVQTYNIDFINASPNSITIRKFADQDGNFTTTGDRTLKRWSLNLYKDSVSSGIILASAASESILSVTNLPNGTYVAVEADSMAWSHISIIVDGISQGGTSVKQWALQVTGGQNRVVDFVNFDQRRRKTWTASINCDWSNGGNWVPPGVPIPGDTIIVDQTAPCPLVIPPCASIGTITIAGAETVYVNAGSAFTITGDVAGNGVIVVDSSDTSTITVCGNWNVQGFRPGRSVVIFTGSSPQNVNGRGQGFHRVVLGGGSCAGCDNAEPLNEEALMKTLTSPITLQDTFYLDSVITIETSVIAQDAHIIIENNEPSALSGSGRVIGGTIQRSIKPGSNSRYRFESDSSYVTFTGGTNPTTVKMTVYPDTSAADFGTDWVVVPSVIDTSTNTISAEGVTQFSKWAFGRKRRFLSKSAVAEDTLGEPDVRRIYVIDANGGDFSSRLSLRYEQSEVPDGVPEDSLVLLRLADEVEFTDSVDSRWNMISLPVTVTNNNVSAVFPTSVPNTLYKFVPGTGYLSQSLLVNGVGYWLKFPSAQSVSILGSERTIETIDVSTGWNMIGTLSVPIVSSTVTSIPSGIIAGAFFGYDNGYFATETLEPLRGYWIKVNNNGQLVMNSDVLSKSPSLKYRLDNFNKLLFRDAEGNEQSLYFGPNDGIDEQWLELPPISPEPSFDARFSHGSMIATTTKETAKEIPIDITTTKYPLTVEWNIVNTESPAVLKIGTKVLRMKENGKTSLLNRQSTITLRLEGTPELPKEYALEQNYPNPFNPLTVIRYSLPVNSHVVLKIYNVLGQVVATLVDEIEEAGYKSVTWNANNIASGVYFYRLQAGTFTKTNKMLILK